MTASRRYFDALTGVRAVMMYGVFNCHFNSIDPSVFGDVIYRFARELHIGVPVFYVLSGFLIYYRYGHNLERFSLPWLDQYIRNRIARIYPVYFVLLLFTYLYAGFPPIDQVWSRFAWSSAYFTDLLHNIGRGFPDFRTTVVTFTLTQSFFPDLVKAGISQAWTLTIEESFYFTAPLIFMVARRLGLLVPCLAIALLAVPLAMLDFPGNIYYGQAGHLIGRTLCGAIGCFGSGIFLAKVVLRQGNTLPADRPPRWTYLGLAAATLLLLGVSQLSHWVDPATIDGKEPRGADHPLGALAIYVLFPALVAVNFYGLITERSRLKTFLGSPWMVLLGSSSYCFYLLHLGAVQDLLFHWVLGTPVPGEPLSARVLRNLGLFLSINLLSIAMFKGLEKPANDWIKHLSSRGYWYGIMVLSAGLLQVIPHLCNLLGNGSINQRLLAEDGPYESLQALLLLAATVLLAHTFVYRLVGAPSIYSHDTSPRTARRVLAPLLLALMALFMFAEEISWGQRLLHFATPGWMRNQNFQGEFTFHNWDLFQPGESGNLLQVTWILGFTLWAGILPLVARRRPAVDAWLASWSIPVASLPIALLVLGSLIFYILVPSHSEILEAALDVALLAIAVETYRAAAAPLNLANHRPIAWALAATVGPLLLLLPFQSGESALASVESRQQVATAELALQQGRTDDAIVALAQALEIWPNNADAHFHLGSILMERSNWSDAATHLGRFVELMPEDPRGHYLLGLARQQMLQPRAAVAAYRRTLELSPQALPPANNLAWILATDLDPGLRNGPEALRLAQAVVAATPTPKASQLDTLAAAHAECRQFPQAVETIDRAIALLQSQPGSDLASLQARRKLYLSERPYRNLQDGKPAAEQP